MDKRIAGIPTGINDEEWCCSCGDDNVLATIETAASGDRIALCSKCCDQMVRDLVDMGLGGQNMMKLSQKPRK